MRQKISHMMFPNNFLWGTATAGHQVEGNNINSDWWHWEMANDSIENSGKASDHYRLYKQDLGLAKKVLNNNAFRFSIEWARIQPRQDEFDESEIRHYKNVLLELKRLGLKSMVTLSHFVLPRWFLEKDGWEKTENISDFERFVEKCAEHFGDFVDYWIVFNEPNIYAPSAYLKGYWPPQKRSLKCMLAVYLNMARAHKRAYEILHDRFSGANVGSAIQMLAFKSSRRIDQPLSVLGGYFFNFSFLELTKENNDFIGINYYAKHDSNINDMFFQAAVLDEYEKLVRGKINGLKDPIYPQGIYEVVTQTWDKYHLPTMITENGTSSKSEIDRVNYLKKHLKWLCRAIGDGADVRGYFYWSLIDNFEWHLGRETRFGLFETDYETQKRKVRDVAKVYGKIAKANSLNNI